MIDKSGMQADNYDNENQNIEPDTLMKEQIIATGCDCSCGCGRGKTGTEGGREKGDYRKVSQSSGKTVMKSITMLMTSQIDSYETNEAKSSRREEIIMETSTIVTFSNKCSMSSYAFMKRSLPTEGTCITELLQLIDSEEKTNLDNDEQVAKRLSSKTVANNKRPDILIMANQMYHALNTLLDSSSVINMTTVILQITKFALLQEKKALARLWHKEIKFLFLRCRVPLDKAIENLVKKIFNYDLCSNDVEEKDGQGKEGLNIIILTKTEIEEFISQEVVIEQILYRYLIKTDRTKLKKCGTIERLILFTREAFIVHYTKYNVKAIKEFDNITIGYKVPSKSGKNIISRLSLGNNEQ
ncbi:17835_t:CDS:2 [Funneliformis geosporum]|nr:17835_t:CDS:2 [Funneliformis geosporum]